MGPSLGLTRGVTGEQVHRRGLCTSTAARCSFLDTNSVYETHIEQWRLAGEPGKVSAGDVVLERAEAERVSVPAQVVAHGGLFET